MKTIIGIILGLTLLLLLLYHRRNLQRRRLAARENRKGICATCNNLGSAEICHTCKGSGDHWEPRRRPEQ